MTWKERITAVAIFASLWTAMVWTATMLDPTTRLPGISQVFGGLLAMWHAGTYVHDVAVSFVRFAVGLSVGIAIALPLGLLTGWSLPVVSKAVEGNLHVARTVPVIALVPLITYLFGISENGKFAAIAWGAAFPTWVATHDAIRNIDRTYLLCARSLGASRARVLVEVLVPHVAARVLTGVRVSMSIALVCVVAAEFAPTLDSDAGHPWSTFFSGGLGVRTARTAELGQVDRLVACIWTFGALGILVDSVYSAALGRAPSILGFDPRRGFERASGGA